MCQGHVHVILLQRIRINSLPLRVIFTVGHSINETFKILRFLVANQVTPSMSYSKSKFLKSQFKIKMPPSSEYKGTYRVDVVLVMFPGRGCCSISWVDCKHTVSTCFNHVKNFSICEPGIKFPNISYRGTKSRKWNTIWLAKLTVDNPIDTSRRKSEPSEEIIKHLPADEKDSYS